MLFLEFHGPWPVCHLLCTFGLLTFVSYIVSRIFVCTQGKNREKYSYSIFLEVQVFKLVLNSIMTKSHLLLSISQ